MAIATARGSAQSSSRMRTLTEAYNELRRRMIEYSWARLIAWFTDDAIVAANNRRLCRNHLLGVALSHVDSCG